MPCMTASTGVTFCGRRGSGSELIVALPGSIEVIGPRQEVIVGDHFDAARCCHRIGAVCRARSGRVAREARSQANPAALRCPEAWCLHRRCSNPPGCPRAGVSRQSRFGHSGWDSGVLGPTRWATRSITVGRRRRARSEVRGSSGHQCRGTACWHRRRWLFARTPKPAWISWSVGFFRCA